MNDKAIEAYAAHVELVRKIAARILEHAENYLGASPEEITWAKVGSAEHFATELLEISDAMFGEGEHAK
jgi:hypothetical protein